MWYNYEMLKIYNTLTRNLEEFKSINKNQIRIYSCGPTVYHYQTIGNMRSYVFADTLNRVLKANYPESMITHVINITDVGHMVGDGDVGEDKMEKASKRTGMTVYEVAETYTRDYLESINMLNIGDNEMKKYGEIESDKFTFTFATKYIDEQIEMVSKLEKNGYTYKTSDGIYFDTSLLENYADFAKLNLEGLEKGKRVSDDMDEKKNKSDFALWKFSPKNEQRQMEWESPWGLGFPGWHIECSAMSKAILGDNFDIHTGGIDHIPVHHTNEIAQSMCSLPHAQIDNNNEIKSNVNYWMHNNFILDKTGKMSKSNDDFVRMKTLVDAGYDPSSYRYLLLTTHYRKELEFSFESLDAASNALKKMQKYMHEAAKNPTNIIDATKYRVNEDYYSKFLEAINDDLNTSKALAIVWELINDSNKMNPNTNDINNKSIENKNLFYPYSTILKMNKVLGLDLSHKANEIKLSDEDKKKLIDLYAKRKLARENKNWPESDTLREEIRKMGVEVVD
jgi:cysteinyl-tRNA synthetase